LFIGSQRPLRKLHNIVKSATTPWGRVESLLANQPIEKHIQSFALMPLVFELRYRRALIQDVREPIYDSEIKAKPHATSNMLTQEEGYQK
jgi:hypothetical protein